MKNDGKGENGNKGIGGAGTHFKLPEPPKPTTAKTYQSLPEAPKPDFVDKDGFEYRYDKENGLLFAEKHGQKYVYNPGNFNVMNQRKLEGPTDINRWQDYNGGDVSQFRIDSAKKEVFYTQLKAEGKVADSRPLPTRPKAASEPAPSSAGLATTPSTPPRKNSTPTPYGDISAIKSNVGKLGNMPSAQATVNPASAPKPSSAVTDSKQAGHYGYIPRETKSSSPVADQNHPHYNFLPSNPVKAATPNTPSTTRAPVDTPQYGGLDAAFKNAMEEFEKTKSPTQAGQYGYIPQPLPPKDLAFNAFVKAVESKNVKQIVEAGRVALKEGVSSDILDKSLGDKGFKSRDNEGKATNMTFEVLNAKHTKAEQAMAKFEATPEKTSNKRTADRPVVGEQTARFSKRQSTEINKGSVPTH